MPHHEQASSSAESPEDLKLKILDVLQRLETALTTQPYGSPDRMGKIELKPFVEELKTLRKFPYITIVSCILNRIMVFIGGDSVDREWGLYYLRGVKGNLYAPHMIDKVRLDTAREAELRELLDIADDVTPHLKPIAPISQPPRLAIQSGEVSALQDRLRKFESHPVYQGQVRWLGQFLEGHRGDYSYGAGTMPAQTFDELIRLPIWYFQMLQSVLIQMAAHYYPMQKPQPPGPVEWFLREMKAESLKFLRNIGVWPETDQDHLNRKVRRLESRVKELEKQLEDARAQQGDSVRIKEMEAQIASLTIQLGVALQASFEPDSQLAQELLKIDQGPLSAGNLETDTVMELWRKHGGDLNKFKRKLSRLVERGTHPDTTKWVVDGIAKTHPTLSEHIAALFRVQFANRDRVVNELVLQLTRDGRIENKWKYTKG